MKLSTSPDYSLFLTDWDLSNRIGALGSQGSHLPREFVELVDEAKLRLRSDSSD